MSRLAFIPLMACALMVTPAHSETPTVQEFEPTSSAAPQDLGLLGVDGVEILGSLAVTSASGLDPADRDGYAFTVDADGPLTVTLEQLSGSGTPPFILSLVQGPLGEAVQVGAVVGPAPLTLSVVSVTADQPLRLLVGAFHDGGAVDYRVDIALESSLPTWTGRLCDPVFESTEPNDDFLDATDLGDFDGVLCAEGSLDAVHAAAAEDESDRDLFTFRNLLPVPARLTVRADPGSVVVAVQRLVFIGTADVASLRFGEQAVIELPVLQPGQEYGIVVTAEIGEAPLDYDLRLEPVAPPPEDPPAPLDILKADLRLDPAGERGAYRIVAAFETQDLGSLFPGAALSWVVRGAEGGPVAGAITVDRRGRYVYRAPPGSRGLKRLVMDPETGIARLKGRRANLGPMLGEEDPAIAVHLELGDRKLAGTVEGESLRKGRRLRYRAAD